MDNHRSKQKRGRFERTSNVNSTDSMPAQSTNSLLAAPNSTGRYRAGATNKIPNTLAKPYPNIHKNTDQFGLLLNAPVRETNLGKIERNIARLLVPNIECNVTVDTLGIFPDGNKCILTASAVDFHNRLSVPPERLLEHLNKPNVYRLLLNSFHGSLIELVPLHEASEFNVNNAIDICEWKHIQRPSSTVGAEDSELDESTSSQDDGPVHDDSVDSDDDQAVSSTTSHELHHNTKLVSSLPALKSRICIIAVSVMVVTFWLQNLDLLSMLQQPKSVESIEIDLSHIDSINSDYPQLLSPKQLRLVKTRLMVMRTDVSILMALGKERDDKCRRDPTHCIAKRIANVTQRHFGYLDASDMHLNAQEMKREMTNTLTGRRFALVIDSLEQLPGTDVMNMFQFIDKDETNQRRGFLLFVIYRGISDEQHFKGRKDAEIVEHILLDKWSSCVPKDTLRSVISRLSSSIVKIN